MISVRVAIIVTVVCVIAWIPFLPLLLMTVYKTGKEELEIACETINFTIYTLLEMIFLITFTVNKRHLLKILTWVEFYFFYYYLYHIFFIMMKIIEQGNNVLFSSNSWGTYSTILISHTNTGNNTRKKISSCLNWNIFNGVKFLDPFVKISKKNYSKNLNIKIIQE